jgi:hypothetical protein
MTCQLKSIQNIFIVDYCKEDGTSIGRGSYAEPPYVSISDWIIKEKQIKASSCLGRCIVNNLEINIKKGLPESERKITLLHEMIHAYEFELDDVVGRKIREYLLLLVYKKIEKQVRRHEANRILNKIINVLFWQDNFHSLLFVLKSIDLDIRLGLPISSVFGYGKTKFFPTKKVT